MAKVCHCFILFSYFIFLSLLSCPQKSEIICSLSFSQKRNLIKKKVLWYPLLHSKYREMHTFENFWYTLDKHWLPLRRAGENGITNLARCMCFGYASEVVTEKCWYLDKLMSTVSEEVLGKVISFRKINMSMASHRDD